MFTSDGVKPCEACDQYYILKPRGCWYEACGRVMSYVVKPRDVDVVKAINCEVK